MISNDRSRLVLALATRHDDGLTTADIPDDVVTASASGASA